MNNISVTVQQIQEPFIEAVRQLEHAQSLYEGKYLEHINALIEIAQLGVTYVEDNDLHMYIECVE